MKSLKERLSGYEREVDLEAYENQPFRSHNSFVVCFPLCQAARVALSTLSIFYGEVLSCCHAFARCCPLAGFACLFTLSSD